MHKFPDIPYTRFFVLGLATLAVYIASVQEGVMNSIVGALSAILLLFLLITLEKKQDVRLLPSGTYRISSNLRLTYTVMALLTINLRTLFCASNL